MKHILHRSDFRCIEICQSFYFLQFFKIKKPKLSALGKIVLERSIEDSGSNFGLWRIPHSRPSRVCLSVVVHPRLLNSPHSARARGFLIIIVKR